MKDSLFTAWRWAKWPIFIALALYGILVVVRVFMLLDEDRTAAAVAEIHAQKITLADVEGTNLPPVPNESENNATVAGVDKNTNGIRDDVELAIFEKYPTDKKARAAALQYAMTEQMYLTKVDSTETWKAVAEEVGRAQACTLEAKLSWEEFEAIGNLVSSTPLRKEYRTAAFEFITSHGDAKGTPCDVSLD